MDFNLFKRLVDECGRYRKKMHYLLHKDGEPLIYPRLGEMLYYIKNTNPRNWIFLSTNAVLLRDEIARMIIDSNVDVLRISDSGVDQDTYLRVHGAPHYEIVRENVIRFLELKRRIKASTPSVRMQMIRMADTVERIESYKALWEGYDVDVTIKPFMTWGGKREDPMVDWTRTGRHPCVDLWTMPAVNWDGKVSICSLDWNQRAIIGDLNHQAMAEIWNGERLRHYRELHLQNLYEKAGICGLCTEWQDNRRIFWRNRILLWKSDLWV